MLARYSCPEKSQPAVACLFIYDIFECLDELRSDREIMDMARPDALYRRLPVPFLAFCSVPPLSLYLSCCQPGAMCICASLPCGEADIVARR